MLLESRRANRNEGGERAGEREGEGEGEGEGEAAPICWQQKFSAFICVHPIIAGHSTLQPSAPKSSSMRAVAPLLLALRLW